VASELAPEAEAVVAVVAPAASLLESVQLLRQLESVSRTFAQWSSGVAVANAAEGLLLLGVPAVLACLAPLRLFSDICRNRTHIKSASAVFQHKKRCIENLHSTEQLAIFTDNFSDKEES
jgi:hypothetical protein